MKALIYKRWFYPVILIIVFGLLIAMVIPEEGVYGSSTDWFSQHVALAETIRDACLEQKTLLPMFLPLGGGSNGFQFSYYGYLRPDIILGMLLPNVSMMKILICYMLAGYLAAILLCYQWLREELDSRAFAFLGSMLFMTAGCFFQTHRQVMFVNFMPFLMLALLCMKRKRYQWVGALLAIILCNSFYYILPILAVLGWYWYQQEGKQFLKPYIVQTGVGIGMAAAMLIPTALVILEHRRSSADAMDMESGVWEPHMEFLLYSPYGMGLTVICMYILLLGLADSKYRRSSLVLILVTVLGWFAYLLNGTLYARGKILVPFLPVMILHCIRILQDYYQQERRWRRWPFLVIAFVLLVALEIVGYQPNDEIILDIAALFILCLTLRKWKDWKFVYALLLVMPFVVYVQISQTEDFITKEEADEMEIWQQRYENVTDISENLSTTLYRSDSLFSPLNTCNRVCTVTGQRSTMYSSVTNQDYSTVYYDILQTPIRINNRVAILTENNPFMLQFMGVRYIEAQESKLPYGYEVVADYGDWVLGENPNVLPMAYITEQIIEEEAFLQLGEMEQLEALMKYTIVPEAGESDIELQEYQNGVQLEVGENGTEYWEQEQVAEQMEERTVIAPAELELQEIKIPEEIHVTQSGEQSYIIQADKKKTITLELEAPVEEAILMLEFDVVSRDGAAVVIDVNGIRNKLSGSSAPYPNGNTQFHYQLTGTEEQPLETIKIKLSKGNYELQNVQWYICPVELLQAKEYEAVTPLETQRNQILACTVEMEEAGYFVTSIPLQNGMKLWVDGKQVPLIQVNLAFAGAELEAGSHEIRITFVPPGYYLGIGVSIISALTYGYLIMMAWARKHSLAVQ